MRARILILLLIAAAVGFGTIHFTRKWLADERASAAAVAPVPAQAAPAAAQVLVAKIDLTPGQFVTAEDLRWQAWPDDNVPPSYIRQGGGRDMASFVGSVVRNRIGAGEPITDTRIVMPGDRGFLAAVLQPGMRAISVSVDASSAVAGLVFPGDHVDIILTHTVPPLGANDVPHQASETVLTDVRILALDQSLDDESEETRVPRTATLEVTARQAEAIRVIQQLGTLSFTLRSLANPVPADTAGAPVVAGVAGKPIETASIIPAALPVAPAEISHLPVKPVAPQVTASADSSEGGTAADEGRQTYTLDSDVSVLLGREEANEPAAAPTDADADAAAAPVPRPVEEPVVVVVRGSAVRAGSTD